MEEKNNSEIKQVILVMDWLDMPVGKIAAQVSHASMAFLSRAVVSNIKKNDKLMIDADRLGFEFADASFIEEFLNSDSIEWLQDSFGKLVLKVRTPQEYTEIITRANKLGFVSNKDYFEIVDQGRTVFNGVSTHTCTGFIPLPQKMINKLFGSLPLL